jgi:Pyridoxamine 5'-phosphate oxidase
VTEEVLTHLLVSIRTVALSVEEREQFLAEPHIGALSVVERPDRAPLTVPIWYQYSPGGELWVLTEPGSRKAGAIDAAGRFSLMVQRIEPTIRYVSVEGPVIRTAAGSGERSREMAARYLTPNKVAEYLEYERTQLGEHIAIYMRPEHWLSADLGPAW